MHRVRQENLPQENLPFVGSSHEFFGPERGLRWEERGSKRGAGVRWGCRWAANASVPCGSLFLPGSPEWLDWRD